MFLIANLESERRFQDTHHSSSIATRMFISSSSHDPVYLIHSRRSSRVAEVITALTIPHLPTHIGHSCGRASCCSNSVRAPYSSIHVKEPRKHTA